MSCLAICFSVTDFLCGSQDKWCVVTLIYIPCSRFQAYEAALDQPWVLFHLLLLWWGICPSLPWLVCVVRVMWRRVLPPLSRCYLESHWLWGDEKMMGCFSQCQVSPCPSEWVCACSTWIPEALSVGWMLENASPAGSKQEQEELQDAPCCAWAQSSPGLEGCLRPNIQETFAGLTWEMKPFCRALHHGSTPFWQCPVEKKCWILGYYSCCLHDDIEKNPTH